MPILFNGQEGREGSFRSTRAKAGRTLCGQRSRSAPPEEGRAFRGRIGTGALAAVVSVGEITKSTTRPNGYEGMLAQSARVGRLKRRQAIGTEFQQASCSMMSG